MHAGITGFGSDVAADATTILADGFGAPAGAITLTDDMDLAYASAFAPGEGHLVTAGTGSIALHITRAGDKLLAAASLSTMPGRAAGSRCGRSTELHRRIDRAGHPDGAEALARELFGAAGGDSWTMCAA